jgi:excisionase family DNA binding protein
VVVFIGFVGTIRPMTRSGVPTDSKNVELVTTGHAAAVLGTSRQHVVDLCRRGLLPYSSAGTHRRVRLDDVLRLKQGQRRAGDLTMEQLRSLWLHQVVAGRLVTDPDRTLRRARANLRALKAAHPRGVAARWLSEWERLLEAPTEEVLEALTSRSEKACELRQNSPFAGVVTERERQRALASFRRNAA